MVRIGGQGFTHTGGYDSAPPHPHPSETIQMSSEVIRLPAGLETTPLIGILRRCPFPNAVAMASAAIGVGLKVLEVTLDSERPLEQIAAIKSEFPEADIGVGSVRRAEEVRAAVEAGAGFIVSPIVDIDTIKAAIDLGVPSIPGAATPTEIERALRHGATAVKVFPIEQLGGLGYLRAIFSPLGAPPLIPTGGVTVASIPEYLRSGAVAVGVGGTLFPQATLDGGDADTVERVAKDLIEAIG